MCDVCYSGQEHFFSTIKLWLMHTLLHVVTVCFVYKCLLILQTSKCSNKSIPLVIKVDIMFRECYGDTRTGNNNIHHAANQMHFFNWKSTYKLFQHKLLDYSSTSMHQINTFHQVSAKQSISQALHRYQTKAWWSQHSYQHFFRQFIFWPAAFQRRPTLLASRIPQYQRLAHFAVLSLQLP